MAQEEGGKEREEGVACYFIYLSRCIVRMDMYGFSVYIRYIVL